MSDDSLRELLAQFPHDIQDPTAADLEAAYLRACSEVELATHDLAEAAYAAVKWNDAAIAAGREQRAAAKRLEDARSVRDSLGERCRRSVVDEVAQAATQRAKTTPEPALRVWGEDGDAA